MNDITAASVSPPRRYSASTLWKSQYNEAHGNIWNSYTSLQPSSSIWGPQVANTTGPMGIPMKSQPSPQLGAASMGSQLSANQNSPISTTGSYGSMLHNIPVAQQQPLGSPHLASAKLASASRQRRLSSVTSLGGSLNGAMNPQLWFEDPYLVSPPPSPEAIPIEEHSPKSEVSPIQSPNFASGSAPSSASSPASSQEEFVISPTSGCLYLVQFKGDRIDVFTAPGTAVYRVGDAVMVDADRGRDLGKICAANMSRKEAAALKQRQSKDRQTALHTNGCGQPSNSPNANEATVGGPTIYNPKQILELASASELSDMVAKTNDELAAVALCNRKAAERHLDMRIVDAEYQWDRRKLTFFYVADTRVDFRDLVRELFRIYKTRIWMCATTARS